MKNRTTREKATFGQMKEIIATLVQAVPSELSFEDAQRVIGNKSKFSKEIQSLFVVRIKSELEEKLSDWQKFYKQEFNLDVDMSKVIIPKHKPGFDRLIVIAQGMTLNKAYEACERNFKCYKYADDLDKAVPTNDRDPKNGTYAIWIRDRIEADEELKNLSANNLKSKNIAGITLLERIVLELKYFKETGKHLDIDNLTLCSGSRYSGGLVPFARWRWGGDGFSIYYYGPAYSVGHLRSRQAVS